MFETSARGQLKMIWWGRSIPFRLSRQVRCTLDVTCIDDLQVSICFIITYNHIIFTTRKMTNYLCSVEQCGIELKQPWSCPTAEVFAWLHMYWTNRELRLDRDLLLEHIIWEVMSLWISEAHVFWEGGQQCVFVEGTCLRSHLLNGRLSGSFALAGTHPTAGSRHLAVHPHHFSKKKRFLELCASSFSIFVTFVHSYYYYHYFFVEALTAPVFEPVWGLIT